MNFNIKRFYAASFSVAILHGPASYPAFFLSKAQKTIAYLVLIMQAPVDPGPLR